MTLNDPEWLFRVKFCFHAGLSLQLLQNVESFHARGSKNETPEPDHMTLCAIFGNYYYWVKSTQLARTKTKAAKVFT